MLWDFTFLHKKGREKFKIVLSSNSIEVPRGAPGNDFLQCWPIIRLSMFLIGFLGSWGLRGALRNIWGPIRGILGPFWQYFRVTVAVRGKLGAFSTILWLSVLFGGYLVAVVTK